MPRYALRSRVSLEHKAVRTVFGPDPFMGGVCVAGFLFMRDKDNRTEFICNNVLSVTRERKKSLRATRLLLLFQIVSKAYCIKCVLEGF